MQTQQFALLALPKAAMPAAWRGWLQRGSRGLQGVLASYGLVLFGLRGWPALCLLLATFVHPAQGLVGLGGLLAARWLGRTLAPGLQAAEVDWLGCNGLLVALVLALLLQPSGALALLVLAAVSLAVLLGMAAKPWADRYLGVPLLSLPFVLAGWLALLAGRRFAGLHPAEPPVVSEPGWLPALAIPYLRSLGAVFLQPSTAAGALVLLALVAWSRWAVVLTVLGFAAAQATYVALGGPQADLELHLLGFNAILTALALGGVFVVLSKASLVLAAVAGALATLLGAAMLGALHVLNLPVLAAPFIAVTCALLLALLLRIGGGPLQLVRGVPGRPEDALSHVLQHARRYPAAGVPLIYLPVMGRWVVTQGPNGALTHQGLYAHAWDLEVADDAGARFRNGGETIHDYYAFGAPVVAPADGRVVRAVGHLEDNAIGNLDTTNNWGNTLVIAHAGGIYSALSHLQQGSLVVREGEAVVRGQVLGRVGNSGRSPVPHLHLQLQTSPDVGAPTVAGEFLQFIRTCDGLRQYVTHGSPATGDQVESLRADDAVKSALALAPGQSWRWRVQGPNLAQEETWHSEIDSVGQRRLRAGQGTAVLYIDDAYATVLDHFGKGDQLLALFAIVAARIPFLSDSTVQWCDSPSALPFLSAWQRLGAELVLPFADRGAVQTRSQMRVTDLGIVVQTQVEPGYGLPERLELVLDPVRGPLSLRGWSGVRLVVHAEVQS